MAASEGSEDLTTQQHHCQLLFNRQHPGVNSEWAWVLKSPALKETRHSNP